MPAPGLDSIRAATIFPGRTVLTMGEVAKALSVSEQHVRQLIEDGELTAIEMAKIRTRSVYRIPVGAYDAFILSRRVES